MDQSTAASGTPRTDHGEITQGAIALVIAWCAADPDRVGEVALFLEGDPPRVFGRGDEPDSDRRVVFHRRRPGSTTPTPPLTDPLLSQRQLRVVARGGALLVENIGACEALVGGEPIKKTVLRPGDTLLLRGRLLLLVAARAPETAIVRYSPASAMREFGRPDALGILGESPAAWKMRDQIAFAARAAAHVLVHGASGTGKELAAHAIHALSRRHGGPFVARNAATFPAGLIDVELFGNVKNYPNPGTHERPGLIGQAHGGTLFLDEIGELPADLQAHLLRVLDAAGDYQRLGEAKVRRADVRLVGATNRDPGLLKHDLHARLAVRIDLPTIEERREDIPLIVQHLLARAARTSPDIVGRFMPVGDDRVRVDPMLIEHLLHRRYTTNVREIEAVLWRAMLESHGDRVTFSRDVIEPGRGALPDPSQASPSRRRPHAMTAPELRACVAEHGGNLSSAARALGLTSRYAFYRLLKKNGLAPEGLR